MIWLVLGVVLWSLLHALPCSGMALRARLIGRLGEGPYKGLFALGLVAAIVLMVIGWGASEWVGVYTPPRWGASAASPLMFVALLLFVASRVPTNLKRVLRHPQLTGVSVWAGAHLLANGDLRSLVLFGGLGTWALVAMLMLNRRDGAWQKPDARPIAAELKPLVAAIIAFALIFFGHAFLFGVSPMPR